MDVLDEELEMEAPSSSSCLRLASNFFRAAVVDGNIIDAIASSFSSVLTS